MKNKSTSLCENDEIASGSGKNLNRRNFLQLGGMGLIGSALPFPFKFQF